MGNSMVHNIVRVGLSAKRKRASIYSDSDSECGEYGDNNKFDNDPTRSCQRRKSAKTTKYIFKTLFEEQQGSDVTIKALNHTWNLHKLYLSQSPYFSAMFHGPWVETDRKEIEILIDDENVTIQALNKVFSSFYQDDIQIEPSEAVSVLGAASLLQMEEISRQCIEVMKRNVNIDNVINYHDSADLYSLIEVKEIAFDWLLKNLLYLVSENPSCLCQISCDLMTELVSSPHLLVIQTEFSVYLLLKRWLFLKENKYAVLQDTDLSKLANEYFRNSWNLPYLLTSKGLDYQKPFLGLRKNHLISHRIDLNVIEEDNIMPAEWFSPIFKQQWCQMLHVGEGVDSGPSNLSEEEFNKCCSRVGRIIKEDKSVNWRWTGFNYGLDLVVTYDRGSILLTRTLGIQRVHTEVHNFVENVYKDKKRSLMYRIGMYSVDKRGKIIRKQETGLQSVELTCNSVVNNLFKHGSNNSLFGLSRNINLICNILT